MFFLLYGKGHGFDSWSALLLRLVPGILYFFAGIGKFMMGIGNFASFLIEGFKATFLPAGLVSGFGYALPFLEVILGAGFLLGYKRKYVYPLGGVLMLLLIFGSWVQQDYDTATRNVIFLFAIIGAMRYAGADKMCVEKGSSA